MADIRQAFALLTAGGALSLAGHAAADTTIDYNFSGQADPQNVNILGSTIYTYGLQTVGAYGGGTKQNTLMSVAPGVSATVGGASNYYTTYDQYVGPTGSGSAALTFSVGSQDYMGTAFFTPNPNANNDIELQKITYAAASGGGGGPEPSTWALMITGIGMAGAVLRRRQRQPAALVAQ